MKNLADTSAGVKMEKRSFALSQLPNCLMQAGQTARLQEVLTTFPIGFPQQPVRSLAVSPLGNMIVVGDAAGQIHILRPESTYAPGQVGEHAHPGI